MTVLFRYRKTILFVHMVSISMWTLASLLILSGTIFHSAVLIQQTYSFLFLPSHVIALISGFVLFSMTRGRILKKRWFIIKMIILISSALLFNFWIATAIREATFALLLPLLLLYLLFLASMIYLSMRKPR